MPRKAILPTILVLASFVAVGLFVFVDEKPAAEKASTNSNSVNQAQAYILPVAETNYLPIRNFNIAEPDIGARAAGLFDVRSERFLYDKNIDQHLPIASIAKLMTAVVIIESLPLNDIYAVAVEDINVDGKGADLYKGERIRGSDLLKIMLIKSSNDAALTFYRGAEKDGFDLVARMNEKAKLIGMNNTKFSDPAGLDDSSFSTVNDLVKLTRYVGKYPIIWEMLTVKMADVSSSDGRLKHHLINTNRLLDEMPGIIGGKTGYTDGALETMALELAINNGRDRLISIVLGANDRFGETKKLIEWGLSAYRW